MPRCKCGAEVPANARYCLMCGAAVLSVDSLLEKIQEATRKMDEAKAEFVASQDRPLLHGLPLWAQVVIATTGIIVFALAFNFVLLEAQDWYYADDMARCETMKRALEAVPYHGTSLQREQQVKDYNECAKAAYTRYYIVPRARVRGR